MPNVLITYDAGSSASIEVTAILTWNHTIGSGSDRLLVVCASVEDNPGPRTCTCTYNTVSMTLVATTTVGAGPRNQIYYFELWEANLPASGTYQIKVTLDAAPTSGLVGGAMSFANVDQSGNQATGSNTNLATDAIAVTFTPKNIDSWIVSTVCDGNLGSYTETNLTAEVFDLNAGVGYQTGAGGYTSNVNAATTVTYTYATGSNRQAMYGAIYAPSPGLIELGTNL